MPRSPAFPPSRAQITIIGFVLVCIAHAIMAYYCPDLEGPAPWWAYVFNCVTLLAYQTLDNLDGKQARRTGSSSPLGLLFDHGQWCCGGVRAYRPASGALTALPPRSPPLPPPPLQAATL